MRLARRRLVRGAGLVVVAVGLAGAGWWAGRVTLVPDVDQAGDVDSVTVTVAESTVGRSLSLNVTVEHPFVPVATNGLPGTVTAVEPAGAEAHVGDTLFSVDTIPVRAVEGDLPFWRELGPGAAGADVAQLQRALAELGYHSGRVDGRFGSGTGRAVRGWQEDLGLEPTGAVRLGELVAVPELPGAVRLAEEIIPGARLAGGEPAVFAATGRISFWLVVSEQQAAQIPPEAVVTVAHEDHEWRAVVGESSLDENGNVQFELAAADGGPVCGEDCGSLPAVERQSLRARVAIVPEVSGPAVPVAAIRTDPDGTAWVRMHDGTRREVQVRGSSGGVAVVDGLAAGERVQVLGDPDQSELPAGPTDPAGRTGPIEEDGGDAGG